MTLHELFKSALDVAGVEYDEQGNAEDGYVLMTEPNLIGCCAYISFDPEGNLEGIEGDIYNEVDAMVALTKRAVLQAHGVTLDQYEASRFPDAVCGNCGDCSCEEEEPTEEGEEVEEDEGGPKGSLN